MKGRLGGCGRGGGGLKTSRVGKRVGEREEVRDSAEDAEDAENTETRSMQEAQGSRAQWDLDLHLPGIRGRFQQHL